MKGKTLQDSGLLEVFQRNELAGELATTQAEKRVGRQLPQPRSPFQNSCVTKNMQSTL